MAPTTQPPRLLNTAAAAAELRVSPSRIRQFVIEQRLPARKVGRDLLVRYEDLEPLRDRRPGRPWPTVRHPVATRSRAAARA